MRETDLVLSNDETVKDGVCIKMSKIYRQQYSRIGLRSSGCFGFVVSVFNRNFDDYQTTDEIKCSHTGENRHVPTQ